MRKKHEALSGDLYEEIEPGKVKVTSEDGAWGIFTPSGDWLEGERTQADLHMLVWVGGQNLPGNQRANVRAAALQRMADKMGGKFAVKKAAED